MKLLITAFVLLLATVGFFFYDFINDEVKAAQATHAYTFQSFHPEKLVLKDDNDFNHQITYLTYDKDILNQLSSASHDANVVYYHSEDHIVKESFKNKELTLHGQVTGDLVLVSSKVYDIKATNHAPHLIETYQAGPSNIYVFRNSNNGYYHTSFISDEDTFELKYQMTGK